MSEKFDHKNPEYKKIDILPREEQDKFAAVEGGFVRKEALTQLSANRQKAEKINKERTLVKKILGKDKITEFDVAHEEADIENKERSAEKREEIKVKISELIKNYTSRIYFEKKKEIDKGEQGTSLNKIIESWGFSEVELKTEDLLAIDDYIRGLCYSWTLEKMLNQIIKNFGENKSIKDLTKKALSNFKDYPGACHGILHNIMQVHKEDKFKDLIETFFLVEGAIGELERREYGEYTTFISRITEFIVHQSSPNWRKDLNKLNNFVDDLYDHPISVRGIVKFLPGSEAKALIKNLGPEFKKGVLKVENDYVLMNKLAVNETGLHLIEGFSAIFIMFWSGDKKISAQEYASLFKKIVNRTSDVELAERYLWKIDTELHKIYWRMDDNSFRAVLSKIEGYDQEEKAINYLQKVLEDLEFKEK